MTALTAAGFAAGALVVAPLPAAAVTYGPQQTLGFSGLQGPVAVAVDSAGSVYVSDLVANQVVKLPLGGPQEILPFSGLNLADGLTVTAAGDIYLADFGNDRVLRLPPGGPQEVLPFTGLDGPGDVTVDAAGNVFVVDTNHNRVVELTTGGTQQTLPFTGLSVPAAIAVDGAGSVFVADTFNDRVVKLPPGGPQEVLPFSGLNRPIGVAVDGAGTVFVSDTDNDRVLALATGGTQEILPFVGLNGPNRLALDGSGNVYVPDRLNLRVVVLPPRRPTTTDLTAAPNPTAHGEQATFTATISGSGGGGSVAFTDGGGSIGCDSQPLHAAGSAHQASCSTAALTVGSHPLTATYTGDDESEGSAAALTYVVNAPPISWGPPQVLPFTGLNRPWGIAVSSSGDVYVVDSGNDRVVVLPRGGTQATVGFTGLNDPEGVAVDGAGAVYVADKGNLRILKLPTGGVQETLPMAGFASPTAVAVDAAGNVFVADNSLHQVFELPSGGTQQTVGLNGLFTPEGLAVDPAGALYVADFTNDRVVVLPRGGVQRNVGLTSLDGPAGVAVDANGQLFLTDHFNNRALRLPGAAQQQLAFTGLNGPVGIAVDALGNVFVADRENHRVVKLPVMTPTTTSLSSSQNPSVLGTSVTFTATVAGSGGAGTVTFTANGAPMGCDGVPVSPAGAVAVATCATSTLATGSHLVAAIYSGDALSFGSSGSLTQTVDPPPVTPPPEQPPPPATPPPDEPPPPASAAPAGSLPAARRPAPSTSSAPGADTSALPPEAAVSTTEPPGDVDDDDEDDQSSESASDPVTGASGGGSGTGGGRSGGGKAPEVGFSSGPGQAARPGVVRSVPTLHQVDFSAEHVAGNAILALILILLVELPAHIFNSTLKEHHPEIVRMTRRVRQQLDRAEAWLSRLPSGAVLVVFAVLGALVYGFIEPHFGFNRASFALLIGLVGTMGVLTATHELARGVYLDRKFHRPGRLVAFPVALLTAVVLVVISRLAHFQPGYVFGVLAGLAFAVKPTERQDGRSCAVASLWMLAVAVTAWLVWVPVQDLVVDGHTSFGLLVIDALLSTTWAFGIQSVLFSLLPMRFMDGELVLAWSRLGWVAIYGFSMFVFVQMIMHPQTSRYGGHIDASLASMLLLFLAYAGAAVTFWLYFRLRPSPARQGAGDASVGSAPAR